MEESNNYDELAKTIKIEDITSYEYNQVILQRLKDNDPTLKSLHITGAGNDIDDIDYVTEDGVNGKDMGWLGYYIGQNTTLQELDLLDTIIDRSFYKELSRNIR